MTWLHQILVAIDQLINALLQGHCDETLSSRAWRMAVKRQPYWWWLQRFIDGLFFWQDGHCRNSYNAERVRSQLPPEFRA